MIYIVVVVVAVVSLWTLVSDDYAPQSWTCIVIQIHSTFADRAFAAAGPALRNSLPPHLRDADLPYSRFWRSLKTFLFGQWGHGRVRTILTAPSRNNLTYLLVVVAATSLSGSAYMGTEMTQRIEEFQQILVVLEHICDVHEFIKNGADVLLTILSL